MWTSSGFPSPTSGLQVPARPVQDRESQRITLVLTPTNKLEKDADLINKDSDFLSNYGQFLSSSLIILHQLS